MLYVEPYGKAVVVTGDTQAQKEHLKTLGGRWNKAKMGWMFPGSQKDKVMTEMAKHCQIKEKEGEEEKGEDSDEGEPPAKKVKQESSSQPTGTSSSSSSSGQTSGEKDNKIIDLGGTKRVTISNFGGRAYIDIREWYKDSGSGELKPTKKGISLTKDAFKKILEGGQGLLDQMP